MENRFGRCIFPRTIINYRRIEWQAIWILKIGSVEYTIYSECVKYKHCNLGLKMDRIVRDIHVFVCEKLYAVDIKTILSLAQFNVHMSLCCYHFSIAAIKLLHTGLKQT